MKISEKPLTLATALVMTLLMAGCMTTTGSGGTKVACVGFKPITWSTADTDATVVEVKAHNAVWKAVCEGRYE